MSGVSEDKFALRHELVRHAKTHGVRAAMRRYGCARNTVRLWLRRWKAGDEALADHSRRPKHQPRKTGAKATRAVIAARRMAPCLGARRLVTMFQLPVGKGAVHRILRDAELIRARPRKHRRKADLRAIKAAHPPLHRLQMDVKYLTDIPHYWPQLQAQGLPRFQYTIRDEALGALYLAYASDLSKTYATLALDRVLKHLGTHGVDLTQVEVRTDLGSEFDGDTVHYRPDGFHGTILAAGAKHRFNPPARPNANADVESSHATIEAELFDLENFRGPAHFLDAVTTYQHFFNFARRNRSRGNRAPADILAERATKIDPRALLLPPIILSTEVGQNLSGPPARAGSDHRAPAQPIAEAEQPAGILRVASSRRLEGRRQHGPRVFPPGERGGGERIRLHAEFIALLDGHPHAGDDAPAAPKVPAALRMPQGALRLGVRDGRGTP